MKEKCHYKVLHHNEHGYVIQCEQCQHLQVAFGTASISLTEEQFQEYLEEMHDYYNQYNKNCCPFEKVIHIPTNTRSITLIYTLSELETLIDLLEQACISMQISKMLVSK